ncbi:hypothetical protein [Paraburkholderia sp. J63]|uniref:hypothetical protein n=1 Tax=Paraburkholderia sp. J63 TaxID=2805434 RepID=UPI002ABE0141|nr:hypothetical protein [Paraburkholderia sp. J63]
MGEMHQRIYRGLVIVIELTHQLSGAVAAHAQTRVLATGETGPQYSALLESSTDALLTVCAEIEDAIDDWLALREKE